MAEDRSWHIDRNVPVALILSLGAFLVSEAALAVWWAAGITSRVEIIERQSQVLLQNAPDQTARIIRLETKMDDIKDRVSEIKGIISAPKEPPLRR